MSPPSRSTIVVRWIMFALFVGVVAVHLVGGWTGSNAVIEEWFTPRDVPMALESPDLDIERVTYPSPLGDMDAWHVDGTRSQWIVHIHGERTGPADSLPIVEVLDGFGYNQLVLGYRNDPGQPTDPSGYLRYGITEWMDLEAALVWAEAQGASEVAVVADGAGASIALEFQSRTRSPFVRSMVFDAPIVSLGETIDERAAEEKILGLPMPITITEGVKFLTGLRISVNWQRLDHIDSLDAVGVPVLVFHGTEDDVVPFGPSESFAAVSSVIVDLEAIEGGTERPLVSEDPETWGPRVAAFLNERWR